MKIKMSLLQINHIEQKIEKSINNLNIYMSKLKISDKKSQEFMKKFMDIKLFLQEIGLNIKRGYLKIDEDKYNAISRI